MSADFWAGYLSGATGILVGNPLDILKVRLQADHASRGNPLRQGTAALAAGAAGPMLGCGALNALLFVTYQRSESVVQNALASETNLTATWLAGAIGGLATWVFSAPTELVKCRAQISAVQVSSWRIARNIWKAQGIRGLYYGGLVTVLRDSVGYGFYFWSYRMANIYWPFAASSEGRPLREMGPQIFLCGGLAGVISWASVFPLDTVKTRLQTQPLLSNITDKSTAQSHYASTASVGKGLGALDMARLVYREGGWRIFFRGLTICSIRAFLVNSVQWATYEWLKMNFS